MMVVRSDRRHDISSYATSLTSCHSFSTTNHSLFIPSLTYLQTAMIYVIIHPKGLQRWKRSTVRFSPLQRVCTETLYFSFHCSLSSSPTAFAKPSSSLNTDLNHNPSVSVSINLNPIEASTVQFEYFYHLKLKLKLAFTAILNTLH